MNVDVYSPFCASFFFLGVAGLLLRSCTPFSEQCFQCTELASTHFFPFFSPKSQRGREPLCNPNFPFCFEVSLYSAWLSTKAQKCRSRGLKN